MPDKILTTTAAAAAAVAAPPVPKSNLPSSSTPHYFLLLYHHRVLLAWVRLHNSLDSLLLIQFSFPFLPSLYSLDFAAPTLLLITYLKGGWVFQTLIIVPVICLLYKHSTSYTERAVCVQHPAIKS